MKMAKWLHSFLTLALIGFASTFAFAQIETETEGMESVVRDDGTFLVGSPTYSFDRIAGAGGIHSESELWAPGKLRQRLLLNRFSGTPSWDPKDPSLWIRTGNELGDMIYQDPLYEKKDRPGNRTPLLEAGFRSPDFHGFWATARMFQVDHYSSRTLAVRKKQVEGNFSWFGENWPMFSTAYGGLGYSGNGLEASVLAGEEYIWIFGESSRWIPVHYSPRIEARADIKNISVTLAYEDAEYQNAKKKESGNRTEWNGSAVYACNSLCKNNLVWLGAGVQFRKVDDEDVVYTGLEDDFVVWPFAEMRLNPARNFSLELVAGVNDRDWLIQDSIEYKLSPVPGAGLLLGLKNIAGTRLNPIADTKEYFNKDTINLVADGSMQLYEAYARIEDTLSVFRLGSRAAGWFEYGAETFDTTGFVNDGSMTYRYGNVGRIHEWVEGVTGEAWFAIDYGSMFNFTALGGFEHIWGPSRMFEVSPVEYFAAFEGNWLLGGSLRIAHSLRYRSDARWNLRSSNPMVVKGDWYWDATFEEQIPKYGLSLTATLLHVLADEVVQTPNGSEDRIRFYCSIRKAF